ncbi:MAG: hypothetical protein MI741_21060, partial [Rhodospirillales bacterium]|nr:hypothetical protein [Rhodospirillales bacterium]
MLERNHLSVVMLSIVSLTVILLSTSRTDAALLAYDPVDGYASDSSIIGTPVGGSGFGGNWHWHNTQPGAFANAVSGGMTYSKNGSALQVSGDQRISQYNVNGYMRANLASSVSSGVVYMSILAMAPSDTGAPAGTYPNGTNKWGPAITINAENKEPAYFLDRDD